MRDEAPLAIWVSNPTNEDLFVMTCWDLGYFIGENVDVFDQNAIRMLSKTEAMEHDYQRRTGRVFPRMKTCLRNFAIKIPSHSCVHGDFDKPTYDFVKKLGDYYPLQVGHYVITSRTLKNREKLFTNATNGLAVEVIP